MTIILDYMLMSSFLCQAFHTVQRNTGVLISRYCIYCFADRFTLHLIVEFVLFLYSLQNNKSLGPFLCQRVLMAVEPEKHENGLDKDGSEAAGEVSLMMTVVQSFNIIV